MTAQRLATVPVVVLLALTLALAGCSSGSSNEAGTTATHPSAQSGVRLTDVTSVEQLRRLFNDDRGAPRLLLLLSPT